MPPAADAGLDENVSAATSVQTVARTGSNRFIT
jgi:hypothetical protein